LGALGIDVGVVERVLGVGGRCEAAEVVARNGERVLGQAPHCHARPASAAVAVLAATGFFGEGEALGFKAE